MTEGQPLPLSAFCCQNERCEDYGKKGLGNIYQHLWTNQAKTIRNLRCRTCQKEFSERKGTVWYRAQLAPENALTLVQHLAEGDGIRKTSRLTGRHQETVIRWNRLLGEHGKALHDEQVQRVRVREAPGYELVRRGLLQLFCLLACYSGLRMVQAAEDLPQKLYAKTAMDGKRTTAAFWGNPQGVSYALQSGNYYVGVYNRDGSREFRPGSPTDNYNANRSSCLLMVKRNMPKGAVQESYMDLVCSGQPASILLELTPGGVQDHLDLAQWQRILKEFALKFLSDGTSAISNLSPAPGSQSGQAGAIYTMVLRWGTKELSQLSGSKTLQAYILKTKECRIEVVDGTQQYRRNTSGWLLSDQVACAFAEFEKRGDQNVVVVKTDSGCNQSMPRRVAFAQQPEASPLDPEQYRSNLASCGKKVLQQKIYESWDEYARNLARQKRHGKRIPVVLTGPEYLSYAAQFAGEKVKPLTKDLTTAKRDILALCRDYKNIFGAAAFRSYLERGPWYMMTASKDAAKKAHAVTLKHLLPQLEVGSAPH